MRLVGERLQADFSYAPEEDSARRREEKRLLRALATLRCFALSVSRPAHGVSIHYAGTLPFGEGPLRCAPDGRLGATRSVYVADGSTWRFLPAKGLTFTLMAHARRVGRIAARSALADRGDDGA